MIDESMIDESMIDESMTDESLIDEAMTGLIDGFMDGLEREADMEEWCVSLDGTQDDCSERDDWVRVCQYPRVQRKLGARLA